jgi:RHH-type transcriptional regulator, rel operon repressor / antitoxin RelB
LAEKTGRSKAFCLRLIIESGISDIEDYYMAIDAQEQILKDQEKSLYPPVARRVPGVQG